MYFDGRRRPFVVCMSPKKIKISILLSSNLDCVCYQEVWFYLLLYFKEHENKYPHRDPAWPWPHFWDPGLRGKGWGPSLTGQPTSEVCSENLQWQCLKAPPNICSSVRVSVTGSSFSFWGCYAWGRDVYFCLDPVPCGTPGSWLSTVHTPKQDSAHFFLL